MGVFCGCRGLTGELLIPEGVTTIGEIAFRGCENFTGDLILPESVTTIGNSAFGSCSTLTDIYCKSTIPPQLGDSVFPFSSNRTLFLSDARKPIARLRYGAIFRLRKLSRRIFRI